LKSIGAMSLVKVALVLPGPLADTPIERTAAKPAVIAVTLSTRIFSSSDEQPQPGFGFPED
jgi:hypothetical protein